MQSGGHGVTQALSGHHAFITGGGSGIGLACARAFLADGAAVTIMGRSRDKLDAALESLAPLGAVHAEAGDVAKEGDVRRAVEAAHARATLTIAVANAGTGAIAPLAATTDTEWQRVLQTNLTGTFYTFKHAGDAMARARGGALCAISSIAAVRTHRFMHAYVVSKAGIDMLVRNTADELAAAGVRVNSVCPGLVDTEIAAGLFASEPVYESYIDNIPLGRTGQPDDIAAGGAISVRSRIELDHRHRAVGRRGPSSATGSRLRPVHRRHVQTPGGCLMSLSTLSRSIEGKVAIVTGAASGMGRATVRVFADQGAKVAALDVNAESLNAVVRELEGDYPVKDWAVDLGDKDAIVETFTDIADHFGGIDILINNAGVSLFAPIDSDDYEAAWERSLAVLLTAHTRTIRAALPWLRKAEHPRIVNIASTEAFGATKFGSPYTAAKTGRGGADPITRGGAGGGRHHRELHLPRAHPHGYDRGDSRRGQAGVRAAAHGTQTLRRPGGGGAHDPGAGAAGGRLHHRRGLARGRGASGAERLMAGERGGSTHRVPWRMVAAYGAPAVGAGYMYLMLALYVMKFSTDVLLIAPVAMGVIFSASRIWDAVSDPLVGYLSDRTSSRFGRRRSWIIASIVPVGLAFVMVFSPPESLEGGALVAWMAVAIIGFYSAMTVFFVPHLSLGAELSTDYHERSRLFGMRHAAYTFGSILSLVSFYFLILAEQQGHQAVRGLALELAIGSALATCGLIAYAGLQLREPREYQGRVKATPFQAFHDVWRNSHARLLITVTFIEQVGSSAIGVLTLYIAQYVVGAPTRAPLFILCYMVPSTLSVPLWIPLSRRFGKIHLWMFSMLLTGLSFGSMFALPFLGDITTKSAYIAVAAVFAGLAAGCGGTISPSVQSDVIDYDEYMTGERKEGSYFAAWNFVYKGALGVMLLLTGFVLEFSGFVPNQPQTMTVQIAMVTLYGLFPLVCYLIGAVLFNRFKLDEANHAAIREELDRRREAERAMPDVRQAPPAAGDAVSSPV